MGTGASVLSTRILMRFRKRLKATDSYDFGEFNEHDVDGTGVCFTEDYQRANVPVLVIESTEPKKIEKKTNNLSHSRTLNDAEANALIEQKLPEITIKSVNRELKAHPLLVSEFILVKEENMDDPSEDLDCMLPASVQQSPSKLPVFLIPNRNKSSTETILMKCNRLFKTVYAINAICDPILYAEDSSAVYSMRKYLNPRSYKEFTAFDNSTTSEVEIRACSQISDIIQLTDRWDFYYYTDVMHFRNEPNKMRIQPGRWLLMSDQIYQGVIFNCPNIKFVHLHWSPSNANG
ncbi:hypothetical protein Ciccas_012324 [Cichlidogyrus casuarinus]|uniref:Uncharacterized protein n=1 Tax=Cichlidogyrus casuarinus TaxID=1844966 RepID=A0ABD2PPM6_9PLAT